MKKAWAAILVLALLTPTLPSMSLVTHAQSFADPAFEATWARTDKPLVDGTTRRSFYWGPTPRQTVMEPYTEGAGGRRLVQYFDKSRMEINNPSANRNDPFFVTNGLLTVELITGKMQVGNSQYVDRAPAQIPLASDSDDTAAPTYATFVKLLAPAANAVGRSVTPKQIDRAGNVVASTSISATVEQTIAFFEPATGHNIPRVFWDFLNASGPVLSGGKLTTARLSDPWFYAAGLPISEPYWAKVKINGAPRVDVYVQAYQRRVLTYVPSLPKEFQVQMGNIGLHYYDWRYGATGSAGGTPTPIPQPTQGSQSNGKLLITGAVKSSLMLSVADLKAKGAQSIQAKFDVPGGGAETHTYRGPLLLDLLKEAGGEGNAGRDLLVRYIVATGQGGQRVVLSWGEIDPIFAGRKIIVAYEQDGADLAGERGPARLVIPSDKGGGRSLYGFTRLEVRTVEPNQPTGDTLRVTGAVQRPLGLRASDLATRNPTTVEATYMAGGVTETHKYKGVSLLQLLNEAVVKTDADRERELLATYIVAAGSSDNRQAILSWGELDPSYSGVNVLVAYEENGVPLGGGLTRLVVPSDARGGRYVPYLLSLDVRSAAP